MNPELSVVSLVNAGAFSSVAICQRERGGRFECGKMFSRSQLTGERPLMRKVRVPLASHEPEPS